MRRLVPAGLRGRVLAAIVLVALVAIGLSFIATDDLVRREVQHVQKTHARDDAREAARQVHVLLRDDGRVTQLEEDAIVEGFAEGDGYLAVLDLNGRRLFGDLRATRSPDRARVRINSDGRPWGYAVVAPKFTAGGLNQAVQSNVDTAVLRVNLVLILLAVAGAVALGVVLSSGLTRPLRMLTDALQDAETRGSREPITVPRATKDVSAVAAAYNRLLKTLARQERARREAAASMAHELRTPVSGVLTRLEAMEDGIMPLDKDGIAAIRTEADRLRRLVDDVDRLFDAEQPRQPLRREPLRLEMLVAQRVAHYAGAFAARKMPLTGEFQPARVNGDATRLEQVVDNLVSNALRYSDDGKPVVVQVGARDSRAIVEVADAGIGISAEDLPRVFEPFWRAERSRARVTGGAGLGLAVTRELVMAHEGRITVESKAGRGTTVRISLPLAEENGDGG